MHHPPYLGVVRWIVHLGMIIVLRVTRPPWSAIVPQPARHVWRPKPEGSTVKHAARLGLTREPTDITVYLGHLRAQLAQGLFTGSVLAPLGPRDLLQGLPVTIVQLLIAVNVFVSPRVKVFLVRAAVGLPCLVICGVEIAHRSVG